MAGELAVGMTVEWDLRADDMDLIVRAIRGARAVVEDANTGQQFDVPVDRLIWPEREDGDPWDRTSRQLLIAAVTLEEEVHPGSAHARLAPWVNRLSSRLRRLAIAVNITAAVFVLRALIRNGNSLWLPILLVALLVLLLMFIYLAHSEFERQFSWFVERIDGVIYYTFPYLSIVAFIALIAALILLERPQERLQTTILAISALLIIRLVNKLSYGQSFKRRYFRLAFAMHTLRAVVSLAIFAASWSLLLAATEVGGASAATNPLALAGAIIAAASAAIGAVIRVAVRQRKFATQMVLALDELAVAVRSEDEAAKVIKAWLNLDRSLLGGVDTGVPFFTTRVESEQMRALLAVCIGKVAGQSTWDKSWLLMRRAESLVADWQVEQCRSGILAYLAMTRKHFEGNVDTAA